MPELEPREPFSFGNDPQDEPPQEDDHRALGRRLARAGVVIVLLATAASAIYVYRPAPVLKLLRGTPLELAAPVTQVFKWRNAQGDWQISDQPPAAGTPYETMEVSSDINVLPLPPALQQQ